VVDTDDEGGWLLLIPMERADGEGSVCQDCRE
jgi:hypothetical protein